MEITLWDLLEHYIAYLTSPATVTLIVFGLSTLSLNYLQSNLSRSSRKAFSGCSRLGLTTRSNLTTATTATDPTKVKALFTYPLRGATGIELEASQIDWYGLRYDDLFTFAHLVVTPKIGGQDPSQHWKALTVEDCPRLRQLSLQLWPSRTARRTSIGKDSQTDTADLKASLVRGKRPASGFYYENGGCLVISFPSTSNLDPLGMFATEKVIEIPLEPTTERAKVNSHKNADYVDGKEKRTGIHMTSEIEGKTLLALQKFLGFGPVSLFRTRSASGGVNAGTSGNIKVAHLPGGANVRANVYFAGSPVESGQDAVVTMGRRVARTKEGYVELDGEYSVAAVDNERIHRLENLFEQGLLRVGDDVRVQNRSDKQPK